MTAPLLALLCAFAASAARPGPTALQVSARYARYAGACRRRVPLEHVASFPVPAGARWRLFFYPAGDAQSRFGAGRAVYPPSAVAEFDGNGRGADCSVKVDMPEAPPGTPLGPQLSPAAARLPVAAYEEREAALYRALEAASEAYRGRRADEPARRAAREALALFDAVSEPPLRPFYRALSPEFWAWAEAASKP